MSPKSLTLPIRHMVLCSHHQPQLSFPASDSVTSNHICLFALWLFHLFPASGSLYMFILSAWNFLTLDKSSCSGMVINATFWKKSSLSRPSQTTESLGFTISCYLLDSHPVFSHGTYLDKSLCSCLTSIYHS